MQPSPSLLGDGCSEKPARINSDDFDGLTFCLFPKVVYYPLE